MQEYPRDKLWPAEWLREGAPYEVNWTYDIPRGVEEVWPRLTDTSELNRRVGFPEMSQVERDGKLYGSYTLGGRLWEWEELPWEWEYPRYFVAGRVYSRGYVRYLRSVFRFEETAPGRCRAHLYFGWIAPGLLGWFAARAGAKWLKGRVDEILLPFATETAPPPAPPPEGPSLARIAEIRPKLRGPWADRLVELVATASDDALYRIQVPRLAREWDAPLRPLLVDVLHATRAGLFQLTWDVICPHCRGARARVASLQEVPASAKCEACAVEFETNGANAIEITFRPHPAVRSVRRRFFCLGAPALKPHIRVQETLAPGEIRTISARLPTGRYRLRLRGLQTYRLLDVNGAPAEIALENPTPEPRLAVVEEHAVDRDALRPADLFGLHEFRDLCTEEALAPGVVLDVGVQTILFTDIVGSTRLYHDRGDAPAFAAVRRHFDAISSVVREFEGALVKTVGDAAMISFLRPDLAVRAAVELQRAFPGPLRIRVTLHRGPCLAVRLNANVDYFGNTVNLAAKLQPLAGAGQIVATEPLDGAETLEFRLFPDSDPIRVWRATVG